MTGPFTASPKGLLVRVRLTPKAAKDLIAGLEPGMEGSSHLKIKVRAVPEKGKANQALCRFLAKSLGLPKTAFAVISGPTSRSKTVLVTGDAGAIEKRFRQLIGEGLR